MAQNIKTLTGATPSYDAELNYEWIIIPAAAGNVALSVVNFSLGALQGVFYQDSTGGRTYTINGVEIEVDPAPSAATWWAFGYDGTTYLPTSNYKGAAVPDTTAPTVSFEATSSTNIRATFSESMQNVSVDGFSFDNGAAVIPSAVSVISATVYDFAVTGLTSTDTITAAYDAATGSTTDTADNELATFSGEAVLNSIPGAGGLVWVDFEQLTEFEPHKFNYYNFANGYGSNLATDSVNKLVGDGYFVVEVQTGISGAIFGLKTSSTPEGYATFGPNFFIDGTVKWAASSSQAAGDSSVAPPANGGYMIIERAGSTFKIYKGTSPTDNTTWTLCFTSPYTGTTDMYPAIDLSSVDNVITNPQISA